MVHYDRDSNKANQCPVCQNDPNDTEDFEYHINTENHRFNWALREFNDKKKTICKDRNGITVDVQFKKKAATSNYNYTTPYDKYGCYTLTMKPEDMQKHNNELEFVCKIKNEQTAGAVLFTKAVLLHPINVFSLHDPNNNQTGNLQSGGIPEIRAGEEYQLIVKFQMKETTVSRFKIPIYMTFQPLESTISGKPEWFSIVRTIIVGIHYEYEVEKDAGKSPFTHVAWESSREKLQIIRPIKNHRPFANQFSIPKEYAVTLKVGLKELSNNFEVLQEINNMIHPGKVTQDNYADFFSIMLWLEETACIIGLSSYNMENVTLGCMSPLLVLEVPGLAEKRPSVIIGDKIEIRMHDDHIVYQGVIRNVTDSTVQIADVHRDCVDTIKEYPDTEMDVRFILGRVQYERMHQGIRDVEQNNYVPNLFPSEKCAQMRIVEPYTEAEFLNKDIHRNNEQRTAVLKILNNTSKNVPYIVYGPPGTGKTMTIVEAIMQIKLQTKKRILVCAPANAACNMLMLRLAQYCKYNEMLRVVSVNGDIASIPKDYYRYTNVDMDEDDIPIITPVLGEKLKAYRIIVTTLVLAGKYRGQFKPDVVFIDEAAQAREPEACCAIGLLSSEGQLVLAGDPKQLGPSVDSAVCQKYGYCVSILERLWSLPLYQNDHQNNFITMLKLNFRSHPGILELPNDIFYDGELKAMSSSSRNDPLSKIFAYSLLKNKGRPQMVNKDNSMEFCSILSLERREGRSPSYFNPKEVQMVVKYVEALTSLDSGLDPKLPVEPCDIGVVTPYIRQVYKVREALKGKFSDIEVGTTEAFQGREKRVIIITTVRAQEDLLLYDKRYKLGFVSNQKRFNVAITRAMSKLIIIGNPLVLLTDHNWTRLIEICYQKGTFGGADYHSVRRTRELRQEIGNRFSGLHMPGGTNQNKNKKKNKKNAGSQRG